jgi:hypothetical protein
MKRHLGKKDRGGQTVKNPSFGASGAVCYIDTMFSTEVTFGFLALIFALLINRFLAEKALQRLNADEKVTLLESFSSYRKYGTLLTGIVLIIFIILIQAMSLWRFELGLTLFGIIISAQIVRMVWSFTKLKKLAAPRHYVNNFLLRCGVYFSGLAVFVVVVLRQFLNS